jgi:hypothetical protein
MCAFSKTRNELFFGYFKAGTSNSTRWMEVRAVDLGTFATRVLRRSHSFEARSQGEQLLAVLGLDSVRAGRDDVRKNPSAQQKVR